jgi:hypothetical protein
VCRNFWILCVMFLVLCPLRNGDIRGYNSHWFGRFRCGDLSHKTAESQSHTLRLSTMLTLCIALIFGLWHCVFLHLDINVSSLPAAFIFRIGFDPWRWSQDTCYSFQTLVVVPTFRITRCHYSEVRSMKFVVLKMRKCLYIISRFL